MEIECPQCNATYRIPENKVPKQETFATCKKCKSRIIVSPPAQSAGEPQSSPPPAEVMTTGPAQTASGHDAAILEAYADAADFAPDRYALDQCLTPDRKGRFKTRANKAKVKYLRAVKPVLDNMLAGEEKVVRVAVGMAYYPLEMFLGNGVLTLLYNRYVLVATTTRIVAINTNYRVTRPTHYMFQIPYTEMKKAAGGLFGTSVRIYLKRGKRRFFNSVKRSFAKDMRTYVMGKIDPASPHAETPAPELNVCPACYVPLADKLEACTDCGVVFKSVKKATLRSLILPGWGDIYLGHRFLGACELLGSFFVWLFVLVLFLSGRVEDIGIGIFILLIFNGMDALLTRHMARKGYILEKKQPQRAAGRLAPANV
ncbi:MAG: hypothetical protein HKM93_20830 [Desulfobacteraceae bacterium]|nr:hypothetical protein [Desulfobacteraceae bacterium]